MKTMTVGELKSRFSEVLDQVLKNGKPIVISHGKEKVAAIVPYSQVEPKAVRVLGPMKKKARCVIHDDFSMSDEEVLRA